jgi:hypothetical protein
MKSGIPFKKEKQGVRMTAERWEAPMQVRGLETWRQLPPGLFEKRVLSQMQCRARMEMQRFCSMFLTFESLLSIELGVVVYSFAKK